MFSSVFVKHLTISIFILASAHGDDVQFCQDEENDSLDYGDLTAPGSGRRLFVVNGNFEVDGEKVFLSGATIPFISYGRDFGNNFYNDIKDHMECYMRKVHQAGGNVIKVRLHEARFPTPNLNASGHVTSLDQAGTFITDMKMFLRAAAHYDIVAFLTIWNNYHLSQYDSHLTDTSVLQSYIDNALIPLMKAIKDEPGFAGVEIVNKIGNYVVRKEFNNERCFDTGHSLILRNPGKYTMENVLRFISWQADAIRTVDPDILITAGFHDESLLSDNEGFNYLKDECFFKAGGRTNGYLSFYALLLDRPLVKGFPNSTAIQQLGKPVVLLLHPKIENKTAAEMFRWAYEESYSGVLSYSLTAKPHDYPVQEQLDAMTELKQEDNQNKGGLTSFAVSKYMFCIKNTSQCLLGRK